MFWRRRVVTQQIGLIRSCAHRNWICTGQGCHWSDIQRLRTNLFHLCFKRCASYAWTLMNIAIFIIEYGNLANCKVAHMASPQSKPERGWKNSWYDIRMKTALMRNERMFRHCSKSHKTANPSSLVHPVHGKWSCERTWSNYSQGFYSSRSK